jgi:hypothetical protein
VNSDIDYFFGDKGDWFPAKILFRNLLDDFILNFRIRRPDGQGFVEQAIIPMIGKYPRDS